MPSFENEQQEFKLIHVEQLHPTFGAEISGVDFSKPVDEETFDEILRAISKYGVCVFRSAIFSDETQIGFSSRFGELDKYTPYVGSKTASRLPHDEIFDISNLDKDGNLRAMDSQAANFSKGNTFFHVDLSFNPRRAGYSLLRAVQLPPPNTGGETEYADTRAAYEDLPEDLKDELRRNDYVVAHSLWNSRKKAAPEFFADVDPLDYPMSLHRLVQFHEPSGRTNLYIAAHAHHIEGLEPEASRALLERLYAHATQPKYVLSVAWKQSGDMVLWDNTGVMHRATGGDHQFKHKRDMRRTTVHDGSSTAWGLNPVGSVARNGLP